MKKILLVDDNVDNLDVLSALLADEGFAVKCCYTAKNINAEIEDFSPEVIFMDVMLGAEDGIAACQRLKADAATVGIKIVLMTASNKFKQVNKQDSLADYHLEKPFDIDNVAAIAHRLAGA
jgi:CheY-like chemotaxis protein